MASVSTFLSGVKILDLSQYISGPFASLMLGDMGAQVLKIEPPRGDEMQSLGPRDTSGDALFYSALNAGKSLLHIDLKTDAGLASILEMIKDADVLIEGFRPGVMARLQIDYQSLKQLNPSLIYCSISGYGSNGPLSPSAGHDGNYLAASGILDRNGDEQPFFFDPPMADMSGGLFAAIAILGALNGRNRTGEGTHIELGLADTLMPLQLMQIAEWGENATVPTRQSTYFNGAAAYYQVYSASDGRYVMLGAVESKFWRNFCLAAGREDWIVRHGDAFPQDALIADISDFFEEYTAAQIAARFDGIECCLSPVLNLEEALTSDQVQSRGLVRQAKDGLQALFPATFDGETTAQRARLVSYAS
jgi:alpha-methylacyl-CoA racemase